ncbi:hypothetical protein PO002_08310 [Cupriavidus necator]|uniref:hypothetical protein n=1 Tax=Cupriavidus necator TaxID=106590 RepID=UPI0039C1373A
MSLKTALDLVSKPAGTARLLEGASTLVRAKEAGVSVRQLRAVFPDLKSLSDDQINNFTDVSQKFFNGELRVSGTVFNKEMRKEKAIRSAADSRKGASKLA